MKQKLISLLAVILIIVQGTSASFVATSNKTTYELYYSNKVISNILPIISKGNNYYIPMENFLKSAKINYTKDKNGNITIEIFESKYVFNGNTKEVLKDAKVVPNIVGPEIIDKTTYIPLSTLYNTLEVYSKIESAKNITKIKLYPTLKLLKKLYFEAPVIAKEEGKGIDVTFSNIIPTNTTFWVGLSSEKYLRGTEVKQWLQWQKPISDSLIPSSDKSKGYNILNSVKITLKKNDQIMKSYILSSNWLFQRSSLAIDEIDGFDKVSYELMIISEKELDDFLKQNPLITIKYDDLNLVIDNMTDEEHYYIENIQASDKATLNNKYYCAANYYSIDDLNNIKPINYKGTYGNGTIDKSKVKQSSIIIIYDSNYNIKNSYFIE